MSDVDSGGNLDRRDGTISTGFLAGDTLNFTNQNGITGSYNAATGVLTLSGTATRGAIPGRAGLDHLQLHRQWRSDRRRHRHRRTINWAVNDGTGNGSSTPATSTLDARCTWRRP